MVSFMSHETQLDEVYGRSFALYGKAEIEEYIGFLQQRFEANGIDPRAVFENRLCLDGGSGTGRGSLFMLQNGASSVSAVDISPTNVDSTARNLRSFEFDNFESREASLEHLPYDDQTFDLVFCNGVIMITDEPDSCLKEITRVTKVGGQAWIYVFGAGGLSFYVIRRLRNIIRTLDTQTVLDALRLMRYPVRYVAEYVDFWKVPFMRTYTADDFGARLEELGFDATEPLPYGVSYDTNHRRTLYPDDAVWLGDGDLRYLATKVSNPRGDSHRISNSEYGSAVEFHEEIVDRFGPLLDELEGVVSGQPLLAIASCANIQRAMREINSAEGPLGVEKLESTVREVIGYSSGVASAA